MNDERVRLHLVSDAELAFTLSKLDPVRSESAISDFESDASMNDDKIQITTDGGNITVKNISDSPISEMSIYYKYLIDGIYYGGIAFSGKFQDIQPGESVTQTSERFSKNGVIVNTRIA